MANNIEAPRRPDDLFINKGVAISGEDLMSPEMELKVFPLGEFSKFVLTEQPKLLNAVRAGETDVSTVIQRQREILANLDPRTIEMAEANPLSASIAMLDLTFAINAVVLSDKDSTPPDEVEQLNSHFAQVTGLPRTLTFQKVVTINSKLPFGQMRTFTDGDIGNTERTFYYSHELMDVKLRETTGIVTEAVTALAIDHRQIPDEVGARLIKGVSNMNEFLDYMQGFFRMPFEHFKTFRKYLSQYPDSTRNASGAFIGMPRLNLRLMGSAPFYEEFLEEGMKYFSTLEQDDIQQARILGQNGAYLIAQCERLQGDEQKRLAHTLLALIKPIHKFRFAHLEAVLKYVPGAIPQDESDLATELEKPYESIFDNESDAVRGTGGFLPGPLLRNMLRLDLRSMERLNTMVNEGETQ